MEPPFPFRALIEDGEGGFDEAYLYDHDVDDLQACYVPATPGQKVVEVNYDCDCDDGGGVEICYTEIPFVTWRLERGDVEPIGPEGKIAAASNSLWLMVCSDGKVIWPMGGVYDSLEDALEQVKKYAQA
jgi:hypothetical protein